MRHESRTNVAMVSMISLVVMQSLIGCGSSAESAVAVQSPPVAGSHRERTAPSGDEKMQPEVVVVAGQQRMRRSADGAASEEQKETVERVQGVFPTAEQRPMLSKRTWQNRER